MSGTGFAGVRGTSPLPQVQRRLRAYVIPVGLACTMLEIWRDHCGRRLALGTNRGNAVPGTGFAGVRGTSPLPQVRRRLRAYVIAVELACTMLER